MPASTDIRSDIHDALGAFASKPLTKAATDFFATLGYQSERTLDLSSPAEFLSLFDGQKKTTDKDREALSEVSKLHLLFQISDAELTLQRELMDDPTAVQSTKIESYLFFAAELPSAQYTRTALSTLVRAINKPLSMPALVLFRHGESLSLGIIHRRLSKRDVAKDVLEKVTLIKDIACADPIRAHIEILNDFTLGRLTEDYGVSNFVALHTAWQKRLGSYALSNTFYREIADWYFWAHHQVADGTIRLPLHCDTEQEKSLFLIRLLTRVIFCWFLVEKRLIPADLFRPHRLKALLKDFQGGTDNPVCDASPAYYRAVLQNLFFGTLNMPPEQRAFRTKKKPGERYDQNFGITNLWRYETAFRDRADWLALAVRVPFLNGGLFDCLDDKSGKKQDNFILDGFSDREDHGCHLPNDLFFGPERTVDLSRDYGEEDKRTARSKRAKVRGLIEILSRYKFTIEENTPLEEEIALDPELLGKVFENLLASYNEDTRTTARKALGAFYTPREIVSYMVDEALKSYLKTSVAQTILSGSGTKLQPYNPSAITDRTRRNLPHWFQQGTTYWVTFRLADSLPQTKLQAWKAERDIWRHHNPEPWDDEQWKQYNERFGARLENWLDAGEGECHLRRPDLRAIIEKCLTHFDGDRYDLGPWVIMPNHVHLLIRPRDGHTLSKIMQGIKGVSAKECNALLGRTGQTFWQDELFDHIVRSEAQFDHFVRYIAENPVKAKLRESDFSVAQTIPPGSSESSAKIQTGLSGLLSRQIDDLFSLKATLKEIKPDTRDALIAAIGRVKILDPACGSGAFPMGALHRLVDLLQKLDPNNESWKRDRLAEARRYRQLLEQSSTDNPVCDASGKPQTGLSGLHSELAACDARIADIEKSFDTRYHALDFARKLYLIENCIYGVDIQPIATQIAKLRFFISLVVDQKVDAATPNLGVRPLPNLETRLVAADTLIPIEKTESDLFSADLDRLRAELADIRHQHFNARSPAAKRKWRDADEAKRTEIAVLLESNHALPRASAQKLAAWDPYDQNVSAPFFDSEWMFGLPVGKVRVEGTAPGTLLGNFSLVNELTGQGELIANAPREIDSGFDVVIGNPPYVRQEKITHLKPRFQRAYPETYVGTADLYVYFYDCAIKLLCPDGTLSYITSNSFLNSAFGERLRHHLATAMRIIVLVDFAEANVFTAITEPCILIGAKGTSSRASFKALRWDQEKKPENFSAELNAGAFSIPQDALGRTPWQIEVPSVRRLLADLCCRFRPLREVVKDQNFYGVKTGFNDAFLIDGSTKDALIKQDKNSAKIISPYLRGRDMRPWTPEFADQWMIFTRHGTDIDAFPAIKKHLSRFREQLEPRPRDWSRDRIWPGRKPGPYKWFEIQDNVAYHGEFLKPKIIYQEINRTDAFAFDDRGLLLNNKLFMLPDAPLWLLGVLNSRVASFFLHRSTGVPEGGFLALQWPVLSPLPVAEPKIAEGPSLVCLVNILRWLTAHFADITSTQTTRDPLMLAYWERILNGLVYELYFPEELHAAGLRLFDSVAQAILPVIPPNLTDKIVCATFLQTLRQKFEELHDGTHPLRRALDKLQTLETVRIIEGKA